MSSPTGFYYTYVFANSVCGFTEQSPYEVYAFATDVCLQSSATTSFILKYTLSYGSPSILKYSYTTPNCDVTKASTNSTMPLICQGGYGNSSYYHGYSSSSDFKTIMPNADTVYAVATYFGDNQCSKMLSFTAVINDDCIADSESTSIYADYPTKNVYSKTTNCTGPSKVTKYVSSCTATGTTTSSFSYVNSILLNQGSSSNSNDSLSTNALIGVIVGGVVGGIALIAVVYYIIAKFFVSKSEPLLHKNPTTSIDDRSSSTSSVQRSFRF